METFTIISLILITVGIALTTALVIMTINNLRKIERIKQEDWERLSIPSFWATVEVTSWARDFSYEDYLLMHTKRHAQGNPMSERAYYDFCALLTVHMEKHP